VWLGPTFYMRRPVKLARSHNETHPSSVPSRAVLATAFALSSAVEYAAHMTAIDCAWRLTCRIEDFLETGAKLAVDEAILGLPLKAFFLLLSSSTGLAFRRCQLAWVNGGMFVGLQFQMRVPRRCNWRWGAAFQTLGGKPIISRSRSASGVFYECPRVHHLVIGGSSVALACRSPILPENCR